MQSAPGASEKLKNNLKNVKNILFVLSGKGGVGKSTFSTQIALTLANKNPESIVALLDVDITGPSVPKILNLSGENVFKRDSGFIPIVGVPVVREGCSDSDTKGENAPAEQDIESFGKSKKSSSAALNPARARKCLNLRTMSIGFLMKKSDEAVIWRGPKKHNMIQTFLEDVDWNAAIRESSATENSSSPSTIDYLIIDTPPGTSDEHISCAQLLAGLPTHAVIVTTPQEVSLSDVRREINFCRKLGVKILGVVENMSGFACPCCHEITNIFSKGGGEKLAKESSIEFLGAVPIDPNIASGMDEGKDFVDAYKDSTSALVIRDIVGKIEERLG